MEKICPSGLKKELDLLRRKPDSDGLKHFFQTVMTLGRAYQKQVVDDAVQNAQSVMGENSAYQWMINLYKEYPMDIGVLSPIILNLIRLDPGQAMFLPAGTLHAYLDGVGIELMANSDNVLRGGLTPKHVDVKELLNVLDFEERNRDILKMEKINPCEHRYEIFAQEFVLSVMTVTTETGYYDHGKKCVEILLCTHGNAVISDLTGNKSVAVTKGMSILIPAVVEKYRIKGNAVFYKAGVPI
jgi:mannose-6-phosphate isomerase